MSNYSFIVSCIFVAAVTILRSRCLATIRGYTYRHTDWWEGFMKYVIEMSSIVMIYILTFIKIGSGIQKLMQGRHINMQHDARVSIGVFFFQNKGSRLKMEARKGDIHYTCGLC
jgi:hypothetical protein